MKKHILAILLFISCWGSIFCQQTPRTMFYPLNWQLMNPGALDKWMFNRKPKPASMLTVGIRMDGVGGKDSPMTGFISGEAMASPNFHWGGDFCFDKTGAISTYDGSLMAKYIIKWPNLYFLSVGVQPRLFSYQVAWTKLRPEQYSDPLFDTNTRRHLNFEAGCGLFLRHRTNSTEWYAGISTVSLVALAKRKGKVVYAPERVPLLNFILGYYVDCVNESQMEYTFGFNMLRHSIFYSTGYGLPLSASFNLKWHPNLLNNKVENNFVIGMGLSTNGQCSADFSYEKIDKPVNSSHKPKYRVGVSINFPVWYRHEVFSNNSAGAELTMAIPFAAPGR